LCLAHALRIAMARVNGERKYASSRNEYGLNKPREDILNASDVDPFNCGCLEELRQFQQYPSDY